MLTKNPSTPRFSLDDLIGGEAGTSGSDSGSILKAWCKIKNGIRMTNTKEKHTFSKVTVGNGTDADNLRKDSGPEKTIEENVRRERGDYRERKKITNDCKYRNNLSLHLYIAALPVSA